MIPYILYTVYAVIVTVYIIMLVVAKSVRGDKSDDKKIKWLIFLGGPAVWICIFIIYCLGLVSKTSL